MNAKCRQWVENEVLIAFGWQKYGLVKSLDNFPCSDRNELGSRTIIFKLHDEWMCMSVSINWMAFSFIPVILRQFQLPFYHFKIMWLLLLLCVLFYFIHFTTCFYLLSFSLGVSSLILFDSPIDVHNMCVCVCVVSSVVCVPSRVFRGVGGKKWPEKLDYSVAFCSHRTSTNESLANCVNCHLLIWVCVLPFLCSVRYCPFFPLRWNHEIAFINIFTQPFNV